MPGRAPRGEAAKYERAVINLALSGCARIPRLVEGNSSASFTETEFSSPSISPDVARGRRRPISERCRSPRPRAARSLFKGIQTSVSLPASSPRNRAGPTPTIVCSPPSIFTVSDSMSGRPAASHNAKLMTAAADGAMKSRSSNRRPRCAVIPSAGKKLPLTTPTRVSWT